MKKVLLLLAIGITSVGVGYAAPVNKTCPVGHKPARTDITSEYKGQTVALCCGNCKKKFDADPEKYADKIKAD